MKTPAVPSKGDVRTGETRRPYFNSRDAAAFLGYELGTLYNKVSAGEIKPTLRTRTGRLRFSEDDLRELLESAAAAASDPTDEQGSGR